MARDMCLSEEVDMCEEHKNRDDCEPSSEFLAEEKFRMKALSDLLSSDGDHFDVTTRVP